MGPVCRVRRTERRLDLRSARLPFARCSRAEAGNILSVTFGGAPVFTNLQAPTVNPNWTVFTVLVTATQMTERLTFGDTSPNLQNSFGVYIDDVQLNRVPAPSTLLLLGSLLGLCWHRRARG